MPYDTTRRLIFIHVCTERRVHLLPSQPMRRSNLGRNCLSSANHVLSAQLPAINYEQLSGQCNAMSLSLLHISGCSMSSKFQKLLAPLTTVAPNFSAGGRGVVGRGRAFPRFFRQRHASPTPPTFWTKIRAKVSPLLHLVIY